MNGTNRLGNRAACDAARLRVHTQQANNDMNAWAEEHRGLELGCLHLPLPTQPAAFLVTTAGGGRGPRAALRS